VLCRPPSGLKRRSSCEKNFDVAALLWLPLTTVAQSSVFFRPVLHSRHSFNSFRRIRRTRSTWRGARNRHLHCFRLLSASPAGKEVQLQRSAALLAQSPSCVMRKPKQPTGKLASTVRPDQQSVEPCPSVTAKSVLWYLALPSP